MGVARKLAALIVVASGTWSAHAEPSFAGKTVTMVIGQGPGGGTDTSGRLIASFLTDRLPGKPALVIRNMPGANGMTGMNYFTQQVAPDGLTITMGSSSQADPMHYRRPQSKYDPTKFEMIGGAGRGGTVLIVNPEAEPRLRDKSRRPVVMGSLIGVPRSGMQVAAWGVELLGWNVKWVVGYNTTNDLLLALERGEIDMTSTGNLQQYRKLMGLGFDALSQSGTIHGGKATPRPDFGAAPLFPDMIAGRLDRPVAREAFAFWSAMTSIDKWVALPPGTPHEYVEAYRRAFAEAARDPAFEELGRKISEDFSPMPHEDVTKLVAAIGSAPPEAVAFIADMLRSQGLETD
jgi:Tripartite tricarboxylate transporter family receptor